MTETAQVANAERAAANPAAARSATVREYIESLLVTVILALFGTTFVVQAFKIPSQSMEPTLLVGDHLLGNKFFLGGRGIGTIIFFRTVKFAAATLSFSNFRFRTTLITSSA